MDQRMDHWRLAFAGDEDACAAMLFKVACRGSIHGCCDCPVREQRKLSDDGFDLAGPHGPVWSAHAPVFDGVGRYVQQSSRGSLRYTRRARRTRARNAACQAARKENHIDRTNRCAEIEPVRRVYGWPKAITDTDAALSPFAARTGATSLAETHAAVRSSALRATAK